MKSRAVVLIILIAVSSMSLAAESQPQDFVPRGIEALQQKASSKTEFTLDHSMLVFASKVESDNEDLRRVIAGVNGVSVHSYKFSEAWIYNPKTLDSVKDEYQAAGWKLVMNRDKNGGPGVTDVFVRLENNAVSNVAVVLAKSNEVDFIAVSGSISPADLSHLSGHFGIPKIEGGVTVPNTAHRP